MSGKLTIRGLRFPVGDVVKLLANGLSQQEILQQHPVLEAADIKAALMYASLKMKNTVIFHAA